MIELEDNFLLLKKLKLKIKSAGDSLWREKYEK